MEQLAARAGKVLARVERKITRMSGLSGARHRPHDHCAMTSFLADREPIRPRLSLDPALHSLGVWLGQGNAALEVLAMTAARAPGRKVLHAAWKARQANRPAPVLALVLHGGKATVRGPIGEDPPLFEIDVAQAERIARRALDEPDRNTALRYLQDALPASLADTKLPGIRNEGLFTDHVLREHAAGADIAEAAARGRAAMDARDRDLLLRLGFGVERLDGLTSVLRVGSEKRAVAVLLLAGEMEELASERFQRVSPISWALDRADQENLPWVVMVQGDRVRLYPRGLGVGVGRRGRTDTWVEVRTDLVRADQAALLWLLFSADALREGGSVDRLLEESRRFAASLADRLRERIYDRVVPRLAEGIAQARGLAEPTAEDLRLTYAMALTVLFRLLFIAYAEDRDLLPFRANGSYRRRALKTKAEEMFLKPDAPGPGAALWQEVENLFEAVHAGNRGWGVPAYNGRLFETDPAVSEAGAALKQVVLPDSIFQPVLRALLLDESRDLGAPSAGPVDFRSLRVGEFGTIYEGLLESELALADADLALKQQGAEQVYVPARARDTVAVPKGTIYLHNRSGARKASGSYFTPSLAVDHLLDAALEPALAAHAERLAGLDDTDAAEAFFDIRIADIAMGSGHFLVAAVDRVERALSAILTTRRLPGVVAELDALRRVAEAELAALDLAGTQLIEDAQLLRRLIARRCIYGVDINPLAVDLARLSIWIHTFVPALPLALLDHSLVQGNALVGIATIRQLEERFEKSGMSLFPVDAQTLLGDAAAPLRLLAKLADATTKDIAAGRAAMEHARVAVAPTRALCDLVVAEKMAPREIAFQFENWPRERATIQRHPARAKAREMLAGLDVLHFPVAFPEVFLRRRPGFDVILGNPPWEKVKVEEHAFWGRFFPGLRGLASQEREALMKRLPKQRPDLVALYRKEVAQTERERAALAAGFYPGMGTGDPDLYKAFAWRFWQLAATEGGSIGVVLPRSALSGLGARELREQIIAGASSFSCALATNRNGWMFEQVHPQFTIALVGVTRGAPSQPGIALRGPYASREAWNAGMAREPQRFAPQAVLSWTSSASFPMLPSEESVAVFAQLRAAPRLDLKQPGSWRARPDTELHATADKALMQFAPADTKRLWPVMKGESLDIWQNDRGPQSYYAWADPVAVIPHLHAKRLRSATRRGDSSHSEFAIEHIRDDTTLACHAPRIAFRDITRATDTRTVRAALLPPSVFCAHQAPYLVWPAGDAKDVAFLLAAMCSVPLDWYARRFVEIHLTYFVLNPFPIPRPPRSDPHWQRAVALAGRLASPDDRFAAWAASVAVEHGPLEPDQKQAMIEELDAVVARLYGLSPDQLAHIFDTFHDWRSERERAEWAARRDRTVALLRGLD
jgi:hypothetical protein